MNEKENSIIEDDTLDDKFYTMRLILSIVLILATIIVVLYCGYSIYQAYPHPDPRIIVGEFLKIF